MSLFSRALSDNDSSRQGGAASISRDGQSASAFWQPKFDVLETGNLYELHGEFPGMKKDDIFIEFPEPQTLVVRGKSDRAYSGKVPSSSGNRVEDVSHKPAITEAGEGYGADTATQAQAEVNEKADKPKYWLRERRVGEFSRTFSFPSPVDEDAISAVFREGILSLTVPKAKKPQPRRIAIS
ncbi:hypothetical protein NLG97_g1275 [Lecanicillium saksenae]|uniref:Uncharacterized protein n=1 Tax=Lecanicillium saksenae TaxID=468837 RepID=A0ACC1R6U9_9HYPO|nr:hypothetical protein NLG97_g1275 [Lecanicillium saksenae]